MTTNQQTTHLDSHRCYNIELSHCAFLHQSLKNVKRVLYSTAVYTTGASNIAHHLALQKWDRAAVFPNNLLGFTKNRAMNLLTSLAM